MITEPLRFLQNENATWHSIDLSRGLNMVRRRRTHERAFVHDTHSLGYDIENYGQLRGDVALIFDERCEGRETVN